MLVITGKLTKTKVEHIEPVLSAYVQVPNRRQVLEAVENLQGFIEHDGVEADKDVLAWLDTISRFVRTR